MILDVFVFNKNASLLQCNDGALLKDFKGLS